MRWSKRAILELAAVAATTVVVCVLAVLQYRWTDEIRRSEEQRLKGVSATSLRNFAQEFSYDFERLCENFEPDPEAPPSALEGRLVRQYSEWERIAGHPGLIAAIHISRKELGRAPSLESFMPGGQGFQEIVWPDRLRAMEQLLAGRSAQLSTAEIGDREAVYYPWTFSQDVPALMRPIFHIAREPGDPVDFIGFLIVELDKDFLSQKYLPELVSRDLGDLALRSFGVAVRNAAPPYHAFYVSDSGLPVAEPRPDAAINLFDSVTEEARRRGHSPLQASEASQQWELVVLHPAGPLGMGIAGWRRRNLVISFGLLAILVGAAVLLLSVARRAERLAKLQMEFVAGVSHELCTPLAAINSAAENIVDGVVEGPQQVREYGMLIREQGQRLERLVDEVLGFAAGRFRSKSELRTVEVGPVLEKSLSDSEAMLRDSGFIVQQEIADHLPRVMADPEGLGKCIENLVSNAMKYSGAERLLSVRAELDRGRDPSEVCIRIRDQGIGIATGDLLHIFEPFYRAEAVRNRQIRGVGLGLYLVKRTMEAMGGRVTVASELGKGSTFTLHLPVFDSGVIHEADIAQAEMAKLKV